MTDGPSAAVANLVESRRITAIAPDHGLVEQHLRRASTTLEQALLLTDPGLQERLRYEAGLHLALALMAMNGFRLRSGPGHHEAAIAYLKATLTDPAAATSIRTLDMTRRNRNNELYRAVEVGAQAAQASEVALATIYDAVSTLVRSRLDNEHGIADIPPVVDN